MSVPKNIIYQFSNSWHDEVERDIAGVLSLAKGDVVWRGGKVWKVQSITWDHEIGGGLKMPTLWVTLIEMKVN
jgi:hypothetical protein